ncbi:uncharacterized protein C8Q71DRAFT_861683 [Rhodofomes roseus]|uniref:Ribonuclease H1 N-terminal domain-containing protein n=1 Tax=Rhodofomes roseus TaxID=34475 RepID=A0ABQ8K455_9APHY|nr:uncharacterized protein C8Q71DRAFT_861683 [Rhodofomes roseus]KAH9831677.1 hypothetical protein C8Q71DRAFT_861683 [Rhodofomes roseus]
MRLPPNAMPPSDHDNTPVPEPAELTPQQLAVAIQIYRGLAAMSSTSNIEAGGQDGLDDLRGLAEALPDVDGLPADTVQPPPPPSSPAVVSPPLPAAHDSQFFWPVLAEQLMEGNVEPPPPDITNNHAAPLVAPPTPVTVRVRRRATIDVAPMVAVGVQPAPPIVRRRPAPPVTTAPAVYHIPVAPPVPVANGAQVPHAPAAPYTPIIDEFDPTVDTWYVVFRGRRVGVFANWDQASVYVNRVSGAAHKGFPTFRMALERFRGAEARGTVMEV